MAKYTMQIRIENRTDVDLAYRGAAFYHGNGDVKSPPENIRHDSTGSGGTLEQLVALDGLFGLVAYSCPDPTQMLIIYITMSAGSGKMNHCYVAVAPSESPIGDKIATDAFNFSLPYETESVLKYPFTKDGSTYFLQVVPKVNDPLAADTYSLVQVSLSGGPGT